MKIFSAAQIRNWDQYTIQNEPIASFDLMERASMIFTNWFTQKYDYKDNSIHLFCGSGNNGGDGLVIARLLHHLFYKVKIYHCKIGKTNSPDFDYHQGRLPRHQAVEFVQINEGDPFPELPQNAVIIDGIFGSGLNRPVSGYWGDLIGYLNSLKARRVAIDIPSGLFADQPSKGSILKAEKTFSFEAPKLAFFFPENYQYTGSWDYGSIQLHPEYYQQTESIYHYADQAMASGMLRKRKVFDHKGSYGHALIIAGSYGMLGAALLSTRAALRSGAGLVTLHCPKIAYPIVQSTIPEAIVSIDTNEHFIEKIPETDQYRAIGIGPGINAKPPTINALSDLIKSSNSPVVIDADGLNILAQNPELLNQLPAKSILTPHPKEFERLFGKTANDFERNELQGKKAKELGVYIVLKGAYSCTACPDGSFYFNSTGNPGMATAGSGDVLTGIITSLLAQSYSPEEAAILGVYLHGLAGDIALEIIGSEEAMLAGDIIEALGKAFLKLKKTRRAFE